MRADDTRTLLRPEPAAREGAPEARQLLLIEGESSSVHALPAVGEVVIGRAPDVTLRVSDPTASRRHARLLLTDDDVVLEDLGSHNGTLVNGAPVGAARSLSAGDVITVCGATLVFQRPVPRLRGVTIGTAAELHRELGREVGRAGQAGRAVGLLVVELAGVGGGDAAAWVEAIRAGCQPADALWAEGRSVHVILTERSVARAEVDLAAIFERARAVHPDSRGGRALSPNDGCDADTLLGAARAALGAAAPGTLASARAAVVTRVAGPHQIHLADPAMLGIYRLVDKLAASELPVLVLGESGTGKELVASAIHYGSSRREGRLVAINCAALPEALAESELFGYERGAFSGAVAAKVGLLEAASGGTVFLDEIGELPLVLQAKLLRALETKRLVRLGGLEERSADFRLVAATNRDLSAELAAGRFRQDLLYRLGAARVTLPPLRSRRRELPMLAERFLAAAAEAAGRPRVHLSPSALERIFAHAWPGNVRELKNAMEYAAVTADAPASAEDEGVVEAWHLPPDVSGLDAWAEGEGAGAPPGTPPPLFRPIDEEVRELERTRMTQALEASGGRRGLAAELIGMPRRTFVTKARLYQLGSDSEH